MQLSFYTSICLKKQSSATFCVGIVIIFQFDPKIFYPEQVYQAKYIDTATHLATHKMNFISIFVSSTEFVCPAVLLRGGTLQCFFFVLIRTSVFTIFCWKFSFATKSTTTSFCFYGAEFSLELFIYELNLIIVGRHAAILKEFSLD